MSIEEDYKACRKLLIRVLSVSNRPKCHDVHHCKADQHEYDVECPVLARWDKVIDDAQGFLFKEDH